MKRYIKSSESVYDKIETLTAPEKFRSSSVIYIDGDNTLRFSIENMGSGRLLASLNINNGRNGRFTEKVDSVEDAIEKCYDMYDKYISHKYSFRNRTLTDTDIHDMMYM